MTKQQQSRINDSATELGIIPLQMMEWSEACKLAIAYHASFKKSKKPREQSELYKAMVKIWLEEIHPGWGFTAIDGASINSIMNKMRTWLSNPKNHIPVVLDKNYFENFFRHFCNKLPDFYKNQTLNVLAAKFDSIIEEIKTQNGRKRIVQKAAEHHSDFAQR